ncbi:3-phosphoglycerate dehydrogenase [Clostridium sp. chh4-2]|uniref:hydroxyacid dehydrogenase n=1 Tax=Clostridium sp. chh4-2 TaxID=2067550 RepID=UPI000CCEC24D|nr:hydroxyacid dehydrogenase [Clostridium sp. chh4-2]PNV60456.1 3-phosphoglycerate dehydrogenase [Clostridium sp. chh4-2]
MNIYLSEFIHTAAVKRLESAANVISDFNHPEELDGMIVRGVKVTREMMEKATNLKVIARHGAGFDTIDLEAAKELGIRVLNAPGANTVSVAEMIVARFLEMSRDLYRANSKLRKGEFTRIAPPDMLGTEVSEKTLGLIGMGKIHQCAADMMKAAFHVDVVGYDPFVSSEEAEKCGMKKLDTIEEVLECSDLVSISVMLNAETENMIHGELFNHFKKNVIFVNTARGKIVNEDDLYEALKDGKLRAAAFDVFSSEPLSKDSKLLTLDNFSATPHIGGNTEEALYRTGMAVVENTIRVIEGKEAAGLVV